MSTEQWRLCSGCKDPIAFGQTHYVCSVSTCNRKRTGLTFCSVPCWEAHLPMMRHREAFAVEARAPSRAAYEREQAEEAASAAPARTATSSSPRTATSSSTSSGAPIRRRVGDPAAATSDDVPREILIVVSKLKAYIKARSGMNTSDGAMKVLSDHVRALADEAIREAGRDGRRTVMDRDFPPVR
jgi:hypothetical protein